MKKYIYIKISRILSNILLLQRTACKVNRKQRL